MRKFYSLLFVIISIIAISCDGNEPKKEGPTPNPTPDPAPNPKVELIKEVDMQDNVMVYQPPKGKEDEYILSYENNVLTLKYESKNNTRSTTDKAIYGREKDNKIINTSDPKVGDIISLPSCTVLPNGIVAKINGVNYNGNNTVSIITAAPKVDEVVKDINYQETINIIDLIVRKYGKMKINFSEMLVDDESLGNKIVGKKKEDPIKSSLTMEKGELVLKASFDFLDAVKSKKKNGGSIEKSFKSDLSMKVSLEPYITCIIHKKHKSNLPDKFEVSAHGKIKVDIDADLEYKLKQKYSGKPIRLATIMLPFIPLGPTGFNIVPYLTVDMEFNLEGKIEAKFKILKYEYPYNLKAGYDKNGYPRWYLSANEGSHAKANFFDSWSFEGNITLGASIFSGCKFTINGWEGLMAEFGAGVETKTNLKFDNKNLSLKVKSDLTPVIFANFIFDPFESIEWLEYSVERRKEISKPITIFDSSKKVSSPGIELTTKDAWDINSNSAIVGGDISIKEQKDIKILEFGVCVAEHSNPTIKDTKVKYEREESLSSFSLKLKDLSESTKYYYRSYVEYQNSSSKHVIYGEVKSFETEANTETDVVPEGVVVEDGVLKSWPIAAVPVDGHVNIPSTVHTIGSYAFRDVRNLKTINIPNSVKIIKSSAFSGCTSLKSIEIPNSVKSIESYAFYSCNNLTEAVLPNKLERISSELFRNCYALKTIIIPQTVKIIDSRAFDSCYALNNIEIPDNVTSIGEFAFVNCRSLTSISIPNSITIINSNLFNSCYKLKEVNLPNTITYIDSYAFYSCTSLESIIIPFSVRSIYSNSFYLSNLKAIKFESHTPPGYSNNEYSYKGKIIVPKGAKEKYKNSYWGHCEIEEEA